MISRASRVDRTRLRQTSAFARLPTEIIFTIFRATVSPPECHDPSITRGAFNPWLTELRTKKSLVLVCKAMHWLGMTVLYEDIVFRRMWQIPALARTLQLRDIGPVVSRWIKSIRLVECLVPYWSTTVVREDFHLILKQCTSLRSFSYHGHPYYPVRHRAPADFDEWDWLSNPTWFLKGFPPLFHYGTRVWSGLRNLEIALPLRHEDAKTMRTVDRLLRHNGELKSLSLYSTYEVQPVSIPRLTLLSDLSLTSLSELTIHLTAVYELEKHIITHWNVPRLVRLTLLMCHRWPAKFLAQFGSRLRYLHLFPKVNSPWFSAFDWRRCPNLFATLPALEHLVVPRGRSDNFSATPLLHPTLKHLDVWTPASSLPTELLPHDTLYQRFLHPDSVLPALQGVRLLMLDPKATKLEQMSSAEWKWPLICHPDLLADASDVRYHRFVDTWVAQTAYALLRSDHFACDGDAPDEVADTWAEVYEAESVGRIFPPDQRRKDTPPPPVRVETRDLAGEMEDEATRRADNMANVSDSDESEDLNSYGADGWKYYRVGGYEYDSSDEDLKDHRAELLSTFAGSQKYALQAGASLWDDSSSESASSDG
ncbi:hypothetical protein C8Q76DRAFT_763865 [Earliella scabrosa]|nr:hypothetical protein C8Q76DRAFT_763865 [Earliella scabrosa]